MSTGFLSNDYLAKLMADTSPDSSSETAAKIAAVSELGHQVTKSVALQKKPDIPGLRS